MSDFIDQLQPASWRGVPFGVSAATARFGRRVAVHEYPYRDKPWVEDLGRGTRRVGFQAFLVSDSLIYQGGDVVAQRDRMVAAAETAGSGDLVHPTLGRLTVSLLEMSVTERWDAGRYFEIEFGFLESGDAVFPSSAGSTGDVAASAATAADAGVADDFAAAIAPLLPAGGQTVFQAVGSVAAWGSQVIAAAGDASSLLNLASKLVGPYGRYFNGGNAGPFAGVLGAVLPIATTVADLVGIAAGDRAAVGLAAAHVLTLAGELGLPGALGVDIAVAAQGLMASLLATAADPADGLRLMAGLAVFDDGATHPISAPIGDMFRRAAVVALARAGMAYEPSSYDDANAVRVLIASALDVEIALAGDAAQDDTFNALRALRVASVRDLTARGADLAPLVAVTFNAGLPAVVLAGRLYGDASRADQLVALADPVHPLFMPQTFRALAA